MSKRFSKLSHLVLFMFHNVSTFWESALYFSCFISCTLDPLKHDYTLTHTVQESDFSLQGRSRLGRHNCTAGLFKHHSYLLHYIWSCCRIFDNDTQTTPPSTTYSHSGSPIIHLLLNLLESEVVANDHQMVEMRHIDTADALSVPSAMPVCHRAKKIS